MITIQFHKTGSRYDGTDIACHAHRSNTDDIVGSAVSALVYTLIGGLEECTHEPCEVHLKKGHLALSVSPHTSNDSQLLFRTTQFGMELLEDSYPHHVHVQIKRHHRKGEPYEPRYHFK